MSGSIVEAEGSLQDISSVHDITRERKRRRGAQAVGDQFGSFDSTF